MGIGRFGGDLRKVAVAALVLFAAAAVCFASGVELWKPDGKLRFLSEDELAYHPNDDEWYSESWNLNYIDHDGLYFVLCIAISNIGIGDEKANALFIASTPDGRRRYARTDYYQPPQLVAATDRWYLEFPSTRVIKGKDGVRVRFEWKGILLEASYEPKVRPLTLGSGFTFFSRNSYFSEFVQIPASTVKGKLVIDGRTYRLSGYGFADHQRTNTMMNRIYDYYASFFGYTRTAAVHFFESATHDGRKPAVQMIYATDKGRVVFSAPAYEFKIVKKKVDANRGFVMPLEIEFSAQSGGRRIFGRIKNRRLLDELDLKSQLKPFERVLASLISEFFVYRWTSEVTWTVEGADFKETYKGRAAEFEIGYYRKPQLPPDEY